MDKIIFYGLITLAVPITLSYLNKAASKTAEVDKEGNYLLKMNMLYGILGIFCIAIGLIFLLSPLLVEEIDSGLVIMIVLMLGMFWDMGIPMVLWFKNHRLKFNQTDIEVINVYGQRNSIAWKEINSISFNHFSGFITITDPKGTRLKAHQHLVGLSVFTNMMEAKTLWTVEELRLPIKTKNAA